MQNNETPLTLVEMLRQAAELFNEYADICEQKAAETMIELLSAPRTRNNERIS